MAGERHFSLFHIVLQWINGLLLFIFVSAALMSLVLWRTTSPEMTGTVLGKSAGHSQWQGKKAVLRPDSDGAAMEFFSDDYHGLLGASTTVLGLLAFLLTAFQILLGFGFGRIALPGLLFAGSGLSGLTVVMVSQKMGISLITVLFESSSVLNEAVARDFINRIVDHFIRISITTYCSMIIAGALLIVAAAAGWMLSKRA